MKIKCNLLSKTNFSAYGDVIELPQEPSDSQKVQRWSNVSVPDFQNGKPVLDILYSPKRPLQVTQLEMHDNSTQTFIPIGERKFLIVVGKDIFVDSKVDFNELKTFVSNGFQGITLNAKIWHCSPLPIEESITFVLLHRSPDVDLDSNVTTLKEEDILNFEF